MSLRRPVMVLFKLYAAGFAAVLAAVAWWQLARGEELASHPSNPRYWEMVRSRHRGTITAGDAVLAVSEAEPAAGRRQRYQRRYPYGATFDHVTGYSHWKVGEAGVELALNEQLLNVGGPPPAPRDWRSALWSLIVLPEPLGNDVELTIDPELQRVAADGLGARRGAVVALDVPTGEVLVLYDFPGYDPNRVADEWESLRVDRRQPLLARTYQGKYPPGSVFKPMTAALALDAGAVTPETTFTCPGEKVVGHSRVRCHFRPGHGTITLTEAIAKSCNIALAETALKLGASGFQVGLAAAGLDQRPPLFAPSDDRLKQAVAGSFPTGRRLDPAMLAACGYGQGELLVTPLWVARMGALLGHSGVPPEPHLIRRIRRPDGVPVVEVRPALGQRVVTAETARTVVGMMAAVMAPGGTASHLAAPELRAVGKTGSAQNPHGQAHSWFLAMAPKEAPKLVVAVVVENGGYGGRAAGPVAMKVLRAGLRNSP